MDNSTKNDVLESLSRLHQNGTMSDEEYDKRVSDVLNDCNSQSSFADVELSQRKRQSNSNVIGLCLVIFVIIGFILIFSHFVNEGRKSSTPTYSTSASGSTYVNLSKSDALWIAKDFVKQKLKSPSTAKFSYDTNDYKFIHSGDAWTVNGYMEAQNGFGTYIKHSFEVQFKVYQKSGDDKAQLVYINIE